ncbi:DNA-binding protein [Sphingomonas oryzagri]|uniref:DNA-binding protein n=1 Tax=Sphingomonas oryzagri TaxID=3042314 RepID=UPI0036F39A25
MREAFRDKGVEVSAWARRNGFNIQLVHMILRGERKCERGQSHRIAVLLGLKDASLPDIDERLGGTPSLRNADHG